MSFTLAATTGCYAEDAPERSLSGIASAGFGAVELSVARSSVARTWLLAGRPLARVLEERGLALVAVTVDAELDSPGGLELALEVAGPAAQLGASVVNVSGIAEPDRVSFLAALERVVTTTGRHGLTTCVEVHGASLGSGSAVTRMLTAAPPWAEAASITYDTGNVEYYGGVKAIDDLPAVVERVGHVHVKDKLGGPGDWNFPPLGQGGVDLPGVLATLERAGYDGIATVEVEFRGSPWPSAIEVDEALRASREHVVGILERLGLRSDERHRSAL